MLGGLGPAVTTKGRCTRIMYAGADQHTVEQTWAPHELGLRLLTSRIDSRVKGGKTKPIEGYPKPFEVSLSEMAREKADEVMAGKRRAAANKGIPQAGGGGGADSRMSCPVILAIHASQPQMARTRTTGSSSNSSSAKPSAVPEVRTQTDVSCVCITMGVCWTYSLLKTEHQISWCDDSSVSIESTLLHPHRAVLLTSSEMYVDCALYYSIPLYREGKAMFDIPAMCSTAHVPYSTPPLCCAANTQRAAAARA